MTTKSKETSAGAKTRKGKKPSSKTRTSYTSEERLNAVRAFRQSGMSLNEFSQTWGVGTMTLHGWNAKFEEGGESALAAVGAGSGRPKGTKKLIHPSVKDAVIETKEKYPFFGVRRIRTWCERAFGLEVPRRAVEETLKEAGKPPVKQRKTKGGSKKIRRFERAKPMQMWQSDITQYVCPRTEKRVFLTVFLDDNSRYVLGWEVSASQTAELVIRAYESAVQGYGRPAEVLTDQGRQYASWRGKTEFQARLKRDGVKHVLSRPQHPQTLGKCERLWKTIREEFWDRVEVVSVEDARERLTHWFGHYNFFRPHQSLDNVTPAERFFGVQDGLKKVIAETVAKNAEVMALSERPRQPFYLAAQIGESQVAIAADRGGLVVSTSDETKRLPYEDLGEAITRIAAPVGENRTYSDMAELPIASPEANGEVDFPEDAESGPIFLAAEELKNAKEAADVLS